jgi:hypothetical protein
MSLSDRIVQQRPPVRRMLALVLLVAVLIVIWQDVILPARVILTSQARWRVHARRALAVARGRAAEAPNLQRQLESFPSAPIWQKFYPDGDSANSAAAIRQDITQYAATAGATIRSMEPSPTTEQSGLRRLGVRISASMTVGQLTSFLIQLRVSQRYLRVDALRIVAPQVQIKNANESLLVELQVFGYSRLSASGAE